ncbi:unnamed protein product [Lathyrus sativus]|nr:unnamed protein product [Lathyrus sativus]
MAYVKISLLPLFLVATLVLMFPTKKMNAEAFFKEPDKCLAFCEKDTPCGNGCQCVYSVPILPRVPGICNTESFVTKMVEQHPNLCKSHADCTRKGSGNFCALYQSSDPNKYGVCFDSSSDARVSFKNALSTEFSNMLKMPSAVFT